MILTAAEAGLKGGGRAPRDTRRGRPDTRADPEGGWRDGRDSGLRAFAVQARLAREQIVDALVHYERAHDEKPGKVYAAAIARMKARLEGR